jgi:hypothetical protein
MSLTPIARDIEFVLFPSLPLPKPTQQTSLFATWWAWHRCWSVSCSRAGSCSRDGRHSTGWRSQRSHITRSTLRCGFTCSSGATSSTRPRRRRGRLRRRLWSLGSSPGSLGSSPGSLWILGSSLWSLGSRLLQRWLTKRQRRSDVDGLIILVAQEHSRKPRNPDNPEIQKSRKSRNP